MPDDYRCWQVGPCTGIDGPDQLWMARYILIRLAELYNIEVSSPYLGCLFPCACQEAHGALQRLLQRDLAVARLEKLVPLHCEALTLLVGWRYSFGTVSLSG